MKVPTTSFGKLPKEPGKPEVKNAFTILCYTHEAASSFLEVFEKRRSGRKAKGTSTDEEQDLLRAMLTFASSGLDSMTKQLVKDALTAVIECQDGARVMFSQFIERRLNRADRLDHKFLATTLTHANPRSVLLEELIHDLTSTSLQSRDALFKTAAYFDIPSRTLTGKPDELKRIFDARNLIAHEMDIDFSHPVRNRFSRARKPMVNDTRFLLEVAGNLLTEVVRRLS